jgi:hypothetical protein
MNLTWHIVKKDLRALRWPLALWTLLIAAKLGLGVAMLTGEGGASVDWFPTLDNISMLLAGLQGMSFILVAALIQEDLLVGTSAFWVTRPISGGRLLAAKLLGIGLIFGVLPVLVNLPWWLGCGYGWHEIGWAVLETVGFNAIFALIGLLWAVVTDGYGRFLMWTLVMLIAIPSIAGGISMYLTRIHAAQPAGLMWARTAVALSLAVLGVGGMVVHQFLTRRTVRSVIAIVVTAGLISAVGLWWPWSGNLKKQVENIVSAQREEPFVTPLSPEPTGIGFTIRRGEIISPKNGGSSWSSSRVMMSVPYDVTGLPESQGLMPLAGRYTLSWPDGASDKGWSAFRYGSAWSESAARKALGLPVDTRKYGHDSTAYQSIPLSAAVRLQSEPAAFAVKTTFRLMEIESITGVAQGNSVELSSGAASERITSIEKNGEELRVTFVRRQPALLKDYLLYGDPVFRVFADDTPHFSEYILVNRGLNFGDRGRSESTRMARVGTVGIVAETRVYRGSTLGGGKRLSLAAVNALNEAVLTRVTFRERSRFEHELKTDSLAVQAPNP